MGVRTETWTAQKTNPRFCLYSIGLIFPSDTLIAVSMISPILPIVYFITTMINSGALLFYNQYIGKFDKENADSIFSHGLFLTVLAGILIALTMLGCREVYIGTLSLSPSVIQYTPDSLLSGDVSHFLPAG